MYGQSLSIFYEQSGMYMWPFFMPAVTCFNISLARSDSPEQENSNFHLPWHPDTAPICCLRAPTGHLLPVFSPSILIPFGRVAIQLPDLSTLNGAVDFGIRDGKFDDSSYSVAMLY